MNKLLKWFTSLASGASVVRIAWFTSRFEETEFEGVDKILVLFLKYCSWLGICAERQYLEAFLITEGKKNIKKYNIRLDTMELLNYNEPGSLEEAFRIIAQATLNKYDVCMQEELTDRTFKVDMVTFMAEQKTRRVQQVLANAFPRLTNGDDIDDAIGEMQDEVNKISKIYDKDYLDKLDFMEGKQTKPDDLKRQRFLFKTQLPCIDADKGGMYSKQMWTLAGSPGSGKTRIAAIHWAYQAAMKGIDVLFDELELEEMEVINILIAYHIAVIYNGKIKIPDREMNQGELSEQQKHIYEAAKIDLFESGKYGKIVIRTENLIVESLEKDMYTYLKHNKNTQLWIIDYVGLIKSKPTGLYTKHLQKYEIITEAFELIKDIAKIADIGVLALNQYTDEGNKAVAAGKSVLPGYMQGGQVVQRHSDYDIAMGMTEEQKIANMRTLSTVKVRAAKGFQMIPYVVDLAISIFRQMKQDATN